NNIGGGFHPATTDPVVAVDYYNYLRGVWRDNTAMKYGGNGHSSGGGLGVECNYMFPGDSDPLGWGTGGMQQATWSEVTENNVPWDRRFIMSAGPFTFQPGAVNSMMVGVLWARDMNGDNITAISKLQAASDRAQEVADECFASFSVGISKYTLKNHNISVFPNPFVTFTDVYFDNNELEKPINVEVYGMNGNIILKDQVQGDLYRINRNNLPSGVYFIRVIAADKAVLTTKKIVAY
ncbi:MAG: T9SS type A sorting domain-containing protein, partial [Bacteroidetes bacterium]|nr:T9SS type A sorting domain-containing protein [Bacteroidota bacterium]